MKLLGWELFDTPNNLRKVQDGQILMCVRLSFRSFVASLQLDFVNFYSQNSHFMQFALKKTLYINIVV